jgi:hypothetical protein
MAGASDVKAGGAYVEFKTKGQEAVASTLKTMQRRMQAFATTVMVIGAGVGAMGAIGVAPFAKGLSVYSEAAAQISQIARETGYTREQISGLNYALAADAEALPQAAQHIAKFINDAYIDPASDAGRALREMGLTIDQLTSANRYQQLMLISDGLASIGNETRRATVAGRVLGERGGVAIGARLGRGSSDINARIARGQMLGSVRPEAELRQMEQYNLAFRDMSEAIKGLWMSIGIAAEPVMTQFFHLVIMVVVGVRKLVDANRAFLTMVFRVADIMVTVGTIIAIFGSVVYALSYAFTALRIATGLSVVATWAKVAALSVAKAAVILYSAVVSACTFVVGLFTGSTWAAFGALGVFAIGLGVAAAAGLALLLILTDYTEVVAAWAPIFDGLAATVVQAFTAMSDAIAGGELLLAAEIFWITLRLLWAKGKNWIIGSWMDMIYLLGDALDPFIADIDTAFLQVSSTIEEIFHGIASTVQTAFENIATEIAVIIDNLIARLPSALRVQLGLSVVGEANIRNAAAGERAFREAEEDVDRIVRQMETERRQAEIDASPGMNEAERRAARADETQRANDEERRIQGELDFAAAEASTARIVAEMSRFTDSTGQPANPYEAQRGISVQGTFNAAAVSGFAGAGVSNAERIAEAQRTLLERIEARLAEIAGRDGIAMA